MNELTAEEKARLREALAKLERARVEIDEALEDLSPINLPTVTQAEGLLLAANLSLDYATDHLDEFLQGPKDAPLDDEQQLAKCKEVNQRTDAAVFICKRYLEENSWDVETAVSAIRRQGLAATRS